MYDFLTGQISTMLKIVLEVRMSLWEFYLRWTKWPFFRFFSLTSVLRQWQTCPRVFRIDWKFSVGFTCALAYVAYSDLKACQSHSHQHQSISVLFNGWTFGSSWFLLIQSFCICLWMCQSKEMAFLGRPVPPQFSLIAFLTQKIFVQYGFLVLNDHTLLKKVLQYHMPLFFCHNHCLVKGYKFLCYIEE